MVCPHVLLRAMLSDIDSDDPKDKTKRKKKRKISAFEEKTNRIEDPETKARESI